MIWKRIQKYRVYRKLVLSYLLLIVMTILLLCVTLYTLFSSRAMREIERSSGEMLAQVSYTANVIYSQMHEVVNQLLSDHRIIAFMYAKEDNKETNYHANLLITQVQNVYPFLADIALYNFVNGAYVDVAGLPPQADLSERVSDPYMSFHARQVHLPGREPLNLLTFKFLPDRAFAGTPRTAIVLDVNASHVQSTMRSINASGEHVNSFVIDADGTVLSHSDSGHFGENFARLDYVQKILSADRERGSFVHKIDGHKHLVTYVKSASLDWYFVSVRPYNQLLSNIYEIRLWTLLAAVLLFVIGAVLAWLFTGNLYNPIRALVEKVTEHMENPSAKQSALLRQDEYELLADAFTRTFESARTLQMKLHRSANMLRSRYMYNVLRGRNEDFPLAADFEHQWKNRLTGPYFAVLLFRIDNLRAFREKYNTFDRGLIRYALGNIAKEMLDREFVSEPVLTEEEETAFIVQTDKVEFDEVLYVLLSEIQDAMRRYYNVSVSVSVGDLCSSVSGLKESYESAKTYMAHRLFWGHGSVLDAAKTASRETQPFRYPSATERNLIEAIRLRNARLVQKEIDAWIARISHAEPTQAVQYTHFLSLAIIRDFETIVAWWDVDVEELYRHMDALDAVETLSDIRHCISDLCQRIMRIIEENRQQAGALKILYIVEEIKAFLQQQYADPGLSLDMAAERVGLSAGYVGKLFKSVTGVSFNDYVTQLRMEKAKELLVTRTATIAQIGEMVGICNVPYFTTLFKKTFGMTPSQYRDRHRTGALTTGE